MLSWWHRDGRGPFRNVTADGTHVHHSVPGIILLMIGAFTAVGGPGTMGWLSFSGIAVGIGTSLVLDEFALILHLQDVYWSGEGQLSVEAVSLVAACLGLPLVCVLKGKYRSGLFGLFLPPVGFIGGRPSQPNTPPGPAPEASHTVGGGAPDDPARG